jgi:hypothetical protein
VFTLRGVNLPGLKTILRRRGSGPLGQRNGLSPKDAQELNRYYECNGAGKENTFIVQVL